MQQDNLRNEKGVNNEMLFKITKQYLTNLVHSSIGALTFRDRYNQFLAGTATLLSPDIILTAAHNIYDKKYKYEYSDFKFYPGACGEVEEYYEMEGWKMMEQFKICPDNQQRIPFDFALMKLKPNPKLSMNQTQFLRLESICQRCTREEFTLSIFGYPIRHPGYEQNYRPLDPQYRRMGIDQYGLTCNRRVVDLNISESMISYFINTYIGQSGSPIIHQKRIIGIHIIAGRNHEQFNIGKLMTFQTIDTMKGWIHQLKGKSLTTYLHTHQQPFRRLTVTIKHGQTLYANRQYHRYRNLSVLQFLRGVIQRAQSYHCLLVQGQVLMPGDKLNLIQTLGLRADAQELNVEILKDSARFYFYTVIYKQFKDLPLSTYLTNPDLPPLPDETNINQVRRYILQNYWTAQNPLNYGPINAYLRGALFQGRRDDEALQILQVIAKMIKACNGMPRLPQRLIYRGLTRPFDIPNEGQQFEMRSFTSTSPDRPVALLFSNRQNGFLFSISHFTGKQIRQYSSYRSQNEVLIMPFAKYHIESREERAASLIQLSGPIAYGSRILIWIEDFQTEFYTELQSVKDKYKFEVLYVPSFFIFTKWYEEYGWLLKWRRTEVRIVLNVSVITRRRGFIFDPLRRVFSSGLFQQLESSGIKQNIVNQATQLIFLSWFYHEKKCVNRVIVYCYKLNAYQSQGQYQQHQRKFRFRRQIIIDIAIHQI